MKIRTGFDLKKAVLRTSAKVGEMTGDLREEAKV